jgi:Gpi18-like mannosyltransferase
VAGILVNNLAFLIALLVLYSWVNEFYSKSAARWTTAVFTWFPASLFCTVIYSEGLYLLFSTAALRAFDKKQSAWVALWGAIATAARPTGIALIPAFLLTSWQEKRGIKFYLASLATSGGLFIYSLYCQIKFGDALAFIHAQKAWRPSLGFDWQSWLRIIMQITIGPVNTVSGYLKDPWYPLLFMIIVISSYLLWYFRKILGSVKVDYGFYALILFLWLLGGDPLINAVPILGGAYLLWHLRTQLTPITLIYGFSALALILASGGTWSLNRIAYGIISLSVALGVLLSRYPRWGYMSIGFFAILVITFSIRFAQKLWVA